MVMETITNHCPAPKISLFQPLLVPTKRILWLWVKRGRERCFLCIPTWALCVFGTGASKARKRKEKTGSRQVFCAKGVWTGTNSWHGHNAWWDGSAQEPPDRDRSCLGPNQRLSGATEEDGRESRSEAEGKIETDFLAGVEIIDGQKI